MAAEKPTVTSDGTGEANLAKAFQELAKGERTATALENQLNTMEAKIEAMLAQAEREQQAIREAKSNSSASGTADVKKPELDESE